jgi:hypothetical protein
MGDLVLDEAVEGELLDGNCQLRYSVCTNTDVELREDPYEADVHNTPGKLVMACPECIRELAADI